MSADTTLDPRQRFLSLLRRDILKLDAAELDFGIYRILAYRREQVLRYLDVNLPGRIDTWAAELATTAGKALADDEAANCYYHLHTFFNRYWDDGDFIPRARRGGSAAYAVPYHGQDTHFHWATKGSHYVKSGELFARFAYRDGDREVRFVLDHADIAKDNAKGGARHFFPTAFKPADSGFELHWQWRAATEVETKRYKLKSNKRPSDAGETDFLYESQAEEPAGEGANLQARVLDAWLKGADFKPAQPPKGLDPALLARNAQRYVRKNTQDFFVHPQLGEFLRGELEVYLKHEFVHVWDAADAELPRIRAKFKLLRSIALDLIAFLDQIEQFQATLFEKRKFVLQADYLVQCSWLMREAGTVGQTLVQEAAANAAQAAEWAAWVGDKPTGKKKPKGADLLRRFPHLPLHTRHFGPEFKARVLACFDDLEAALGGELVHADNYAALRTLEPAYRERVKCIYIDPPYNTGGDGFLYKDSFQHSSWASMVSSRLRVSADLLMQSGILFSSIDDKERAALDWVLRETFGSDNRIAELIWNNVTDNNPTRVAVEHEYIACFARNSSAASPEWKSSVSDAKEALIKIGRELVEKYGDTPELQEAYRNWFRENKRFLGALDRYKFIDAGGVYTGSQSVHNPGKEGYRYDVPFKGDASRSCKQPLMGYRFPWETMKKLLDDDKILFGDDEDKLIELKVYAHEYEDKLSSVITLDGRSGANDLRSLFGSDQTFKNPKAAALLETLFPFVAMGSDTVLDFFAGSGTTAQAVISLNRKTGGQRKFVLVEQSEYFDSLVFPRIAKVMTAPEWKDGSPKDSVQHADHGDPDHWSRRTLPLVRVLRLERYEDSLNALDFSTTGPDGGDLLAASADEHLIRYWLQDESEGQSVRLSTQRLADPFAYHLTLYEPTGARDEVVDLLETARLLLGLVPRRWREATDPQGRRHQWLEASRCADVAREVTDPASVLLWLRPVDDERDEAAAQAEHDWLAAQIPQHFAGRRLSDFASVLHNRGAFWPAGQQAESIDGLLAQRMMERAR